MRHTPFFISKNTIFLISSQPNTVSEIPRLENNSVLAIRSYLLVWTVVMGFGLRGILEGEKQMHQPISTNLEATQLLCGSAQKRKKRKKRKINTQSYT